MLFYYDSDSLPKETQWYKKHNRSGQIIITLQQIHNRHWNFVLLIIVIFIHLFLLGGYTGHICL